MILSSFHLVVIIASFLVVRGSDYEVEAEGDNLQRTIRQVTLPPTTPPAEETLPVTAALPLKDLILILMAKHGNVQTALAFNSLDNLPLGEVMRILFVQVDKAFASDIVAMQHHAQNSDKQLVALIARIVTGDKTVSNDIFTWDDKLRKHGWWARIRQRIFVNLDRYVANFTPQLQLTPALTEALLQNSS